MVLRWFLSQTFRQATYLRRHVQKLLNAQRDILPPQAIDGINRGLAEMDQTLRSAPDKKALKKAMEKLEETANKWLKPYPHQNFRENVEVALVAIAVAMGIRTFFLQPFKIPTGSMQPTLYGIHYDNLLNNPKFEMPGLPQRIFEGSVFGKFYHVLKAEADGELVGIGPVEHVLKFINKQTLVMRYRMDGTTVQEDYTLWFTPDEGFQNLERRPDLSIDKRFQLHAGQQFKKGDYIVAVKETSGDHLFVDRLSYNFRRPTRGEIIVFETGGIAHPRMQQQMFYIKRMVAMGGEQVRIGNDRHLYIDGLRLDASTPRFEFVYTFNGPPEDSEYSGHVNGLTAEPYVQPGAEVSPLFPQGDAVYHVKPNHYMVMGDNTLNSFDSRAWGEFSRENVIGKSFFVYWPISDRFGWGHR